MGTNYYVIPEVTEKEKEHMKQLISDELFDELINVIPERIHIGKSSAGWRFCFNHNDWKYFKSIDGLKDFMLYGTIVNEYGEQIQFDDFWEMVNGKEKSPDSLDGDSYSERWDEIHPDQKKPDYMLRGESGDFECLGYRFSTSTHFS